MKDGRPESGGSSVSLFRRVIASPRPLWITLCTALVLLLAPLAATHLDGSWDLFVARGWRLLMVPSAVILYILVAGQLTARIEWRVLEAFRPVVLVSDDDFAQLVRRASRTSRLAEFAAMGAGALVGVWLGAYWLSLANTLWLRVYGPLSQGVMMALLGWTIYDSMAGTRLFAELHRQPLRVDLLDIRPFEPMGRQSLAASLVFAGGILLGALFGLNLESIHHWQSWLIYIPLALVPALVFFLSMRHTHRVLAGEKRRQMRAVAERIERATRALQARVEGGEGLDERATEYLALVAYQAQLRTRPTWPYNTGMLRTLFFSVLVPLLMRGASVLFFGR